MTNALNSIPATAGDSVPIAIASWLACLAIVLVIGLLIMKVAKEVRGKPVAADVWSEALGRFVTKDDCARAHEHAEVVHQELFKKLGGVERGAASALGLEIRTLREERRADAKVLQQTLGEFQQAIGGLKAATALQTAQLNRMDKKLDDIQSNQ